MEPLGLFVAGAAPRRRIHDESSRFIELTEQIFVIEDLIRKLEKISPSSSKARPVLNEGYMIWFDQVTKAINLQRTTQYNLRNSIDRVGIKIKHGGDEISHDTVIYFFENREVAGGVPVEIGSQFYEIIADVENHVKLVDKNSCFDRELFALFFRQIVRLRILTIPLIRESYTVWVRNAVFVERGDEPCKMFYLNIQHIHDYSLSRQQNKLGLRIDSEDVEIKEVMIDGKSKPENEIDALLFSPNAVWQKILKAILNKWLENEGIRVVGTKLDVHSLALKIMPEKVLSKYTDNIDYIKYLNDEMKPRDGIDGGGVTNQFVTELLQNLLDGGDTRALDLGEGALPLIKVWSDKEESGKEAGRNLGRLINRICHKKDTDRRLCAGRVVPDSFFQILRYYLDLNFAYPDVDFICRISKLATSEYLKPLISYLEGNISRDNTEQCLLIFDISNIELTDAEKQSVLVLKKQSFAFLREKVEPIIILAGEMTTMLDQNAKRWIQGEAPQNVSEIVQGKILDKEDIISRIDLPPQYHTREYDIIRDKIDYLKEHIRDPETTMKWLGDFVFFVTGQRTLVASSKIKINPVSGRGYCAAHTCFKTLDVPMTHNTPPLNVIDHKLKFIANLNEGILIGSGLDAH